VLIEKEAPLNMNHAKIMISSIIHFFDKNKRKLSKTSAAVTPRRHGHFCHILLQKKTRMKHTFVNMFYMKDTGEKKRKVTFLFTVFSFFTVLELFTQSDK